MRVYSYYAAVNTLRRVWSFEEILTEYSMRFDSIYSEAPTCNWLAAAHPNVFFWRWFSSSL